MCAAFSTTDLVALADSPANRLAHSFSLPFELLDNRFALAPMLGQMLSNQLLENTLLNLFKFLRKE